MVMIIMMMAVMIVCLLLLLLTGMKLMSRRRRLKSVICYIWWVIGLHATSIRAVHAMMTSDHDHARWLMTVLIGIVVVVHQIAR